MTATLGDFLTIAGLHITAAAQNHARMPAPAYAEVITELDRLLTVLARYASDGTHTTRPAAAAPVPTRQELTSIGIRLTLLRAAETIHPIAQAAGSSASTGHPAATGLRAAAQALIAGRDLLHSHDPAASPAGSDPLWAPTLNARPVAAALMRQLASYAPPLAQLTGRLLLPAPGRRLPPATRQALGTAQGWLTLAASASGSGPGQPSLDLNMLLLHSIPANLPPPRHPPPDSDASPADLRAGTTATAARVRYLAHRPASEPDWPSPSAARGWQHNALAVAIIGHNSELLLRTLADRARQLTLAQPHTAALEHAADAMHATWRSWQAVTHACDPLTTGTSRPLPLICAELDDLVLWTGRLARTSTWTPARANARSLRTPASLARTPHDLTTTLAALGHTTEAITQAGRQDMDSAQHAVAAGRIYSPARLLPESDDRRHAYRYRRASPDQTAELRAAYHHALAGTEQATATIDTLLTDLCTPGEPRALARALHHNPLTTQPHRRTTPLTSQPATAAGPGPGTGDIEHLLHNLKVTDPQLLFRAIALDHATRDLTAEALTKAEQLTHLTKDAWHCGTCQTKGPRNQSARLAAQDLPDDRGNSDAPAAQVTGAKAPRVRNAKASTGRAASSP
jgi:hypothetical protein